MYHNSLFACHAARYPMSPFESLLTNVRDCSICACVPFDDASGERLREWMGGEVFYDSKQIGIRLMGLGFPGTGKSGDLPPRPECAAAWRRQLLGHLHHLEVTLVVGQYAQAYHINGVRASLTDKVREGVVPHA